MEASATRLSEILSNYTCITLKQITKKMNITAKKKAEMISSITSFLTNPENHENLSQVLPADIYSEIRSILPDKHLKCICGDIYKNYSTILCTCCNKKQHTSCMGTMVFMKNYECITCQLIKLNPSDQVLEFLVDPFLISKGRCKDQSFTYSDTSIAEISQLKLGIEVQCRCIKVERPGFSICWPKNGSLVLNSRPIIEFNDKKVKRETSIDISSFLKPGNNEISFSQKLDMDDYCLSVVKVKKIPAINLHSILSQKRRDFKTCEDFIKSFFSDDTELTGSIVKISLRCQFTLQPIITPARGKDCKHLACFDLNNLIEMQKVEKYSWKCPICSGPAYDLFVDAYILGIINLYLPLKLESVEIHENGKISPVFEEDEIKLPQKRSLGREGFSSVEIAKSQAGCVQINRREDSDIIIIED